MINFNKNNGLLSYGFAESRTPEEISPEEWHSQSFLFSLTWATDERFVEKLYACLQTQYASFLEEQVMENKDLLLTFIFKLNLKNFQLETKTAQFTVSLMIPNLLTDQWSERMTSSHLTVACDDSSLLIPLNFVCRVLDNTVAPLAIVDTTSNNSMESFKKYSLFELANTIITKRVYRPDIIISDLHVSLDNVVDIVMNIGSVLKVNILPKNTNT
uniref:Uncharacterized protein n=1 Tax=Glossina austeni TaxID=7395 RepID=A0A1A9VGX9_GLOAU